jgi:hypothetical protein
MRSWLDLARDGLRRNVSFTILGGVGGSTKKRGTLADLLASVPYLLSARLIPPLRVVNDVLRKGVRDAGMSGGSAWEPFEITQPEWEDLAGALKALPSRRKCSFVEPPEWVTTFDDWSTWIMIFKYGYPENFRHLAQESRERQRAYQEALKAGNADRAEALHLRAIEADAKLADFVMTHRRKQTKRK